MFRRSLFLLFALMVLVACGGPAQVSVQPTPAVVTRITTQVVTQVVIKKETVVVTATSQPETPTRAPVATSAPAATPEATAEATSTPAPAMGKWKIDHDASSFDDSNTVILRIEAENDITGSYETYRPSLYLRCKERETEAYVNAGMQFDVESGDGVTFRYRYDKLPARSEVADKSTDGHAFFFADSKGVIDNMLKHDQVVFGFTPFNSSPVEMAFDLRGLSEAIKPLREVCP